MKITLIFESQQLADYAWEGFFQYGETKANRAGRSIELEINEETSINLPGGCEQIRVIP